jgi:serine palmitoyltransferase
MILTNSQQHSRNIHKADINSKGSFEEAPFIINCLTYLGFYLLMIIGYINQLFFVPKVASEKDRDGYVPLFESFESLYLHYL